MDDRRPRTAIIQQYGIAGMADEIVRLRDEIDRLRKTNDDLAAHVRALSNPPFGHYAEWQSTGDAVAAAVLNEWSEKVEAAFADTRRMGGTQPEEPLQ